MKEKGEGNEYIFVLKSILEISNGGIYVLNFFIKRSFDRYIYNFPYRCESWLNACIIFIICFLIYYYGYYYLKTFVSS